jgi:acetoin utilization deacetylase AcuC-like enzyme
MMKFFFSPESILTLPNYGIQIPLNDEKIYKIISLLQRHHITPTDDFHQIQIEREDLSRVHTKDFVTNLFGTKIQKERMITETFELQNPDGSFHRYDPLIAAYSLDELVEKILHQTKGTILTVKNAFLGNDSFHLGGGYHHAMSFGGRGFCLVNDIVIAARWVQKYLGAGNIWIIDIDAHKGDGTAELTHLDPSLKTLSIHMKEGWPLDSEKFDQKGHLRPWFIESDVEIGIGKGEEKNYLNKLQKGLMQLEMISSGKPDLAIVVQGADPYEKDELPSSSLLNLTLEQMLERDLMVYEFLKTRHVPQAYVMGGGYGKYAFEPYCEFVKRIL